MTHPLRCIGLDTAGNSFEPLLLQRGRVADGGDVVEETTFARPECVREDEQPFRGLAVVGHLPASPSSGGSSARSSSFEIGSEEHTSELQPLLRTSYAVFCLIKKQQN